MQHDIRYAVRNLMKSPGFTVVALVTLALGIGANTAVFSLIDQVVLRPLPVERPEELVLISHDGPYMGANRGMGTFSNPMYRDLSEKNEVLAGLVGSFRTEVNVGHGGNTERATVMLVSGNYFQVLGVGAVMGRPILPEDDETPGAHPVVVLSHSYWTRRFGASSNILNQKVLINGHPMTVIGVAPRGFNGAYVGRTFDVMTPIMMKAQVTPTWYDLDRRRSLWLELVGRRQPGVGIEQTEASLVALYQSILSEEVNELGAQPADQREYFVSRRVSLEPGAMGRSGLRDEFATPLIVLMSMVGLVLLIACANVANLLIARGAARRKEYAVRLALGAGHWRVARQVVVESLVLSMAGGALGLLIGFWSLRGLIGFLPDEGTTVHALSANLDTRALGFVFAASVLTGLLFGLLPALRATRTGLVGALKDQAGSVSGAISAPRIRQGLIVTQVALSLLLLIGCGLFARSLYNLVREDPGFPIERLVTLSLDGRSSGYGPTETLRLYRRLEERIARLPGVRSVSVSATSVLQNARSMSTVKIEGYRYEPGVYTNPFVDYVSPGHFATMGMAVVAGRDFNERDAEGSNPVAIINESAAEQYFEGRNPIGQHIYFGIERDGVPNVEIVGVVKDVKYFTIREEPEPFAFQPLPADPLLGRVAFYVRTLSDPEAVLGLVHQAVQGEDTNLTIFGAQTMEQAVGDLIYIDRMLALLSSAFGFLATLLAAIGLYGVLAYNVMRRSREFGIRMAIGADAARVLRLVLREVMALTMIGAVMAILASFWLSQFVESRLFGVAGNDPALVAAATGFLVLVALAAGWLPARRAARVDPMTALRYE